MTPDSPLAAVVERKRLLDVSEVAEWLGVSGGYIRDHASGRKLPKLQGIKMGESARHAIWRFDEADVLEFLEVLKAKS